MHCSHLNGSPCLITNYGSITARTRNFLCSLSGLGPNVEVTGPKLTAVAPSRGGATKGSEHGVVT
jgi:hypothetical protein